MEHIFLLLIDRHKQEVFGENVDMAGPRLYPLVPHVTITIKIKKQTERRGELRLTDTVSDSQ